MHACSDPSVENFTIHTAVDLQPGSQKYQVKVAIDYDPGLSCLCWLTVYKRDREFVQ